MSVEPIGLCYRCFEKQSLQYTGLSAFGLKGTCVCFPQDAQVAGNISLSENLPAGDPPSGLCRLKRRRCSFAQPDSLCSVSAHCNPFEQKSPVHPL
jgi:hypothetical protein